MARCTTSTKVKEANRETHQSHSSSLWGQHPGLEAVQAQIPNEKVLAFMDDLYMATRPERLASGTRHWESSFQACRDPNP